MRKLSLSPLIVLIPLLSIGVPVTYAQQSAARIWNEQMLAAIRRNVPNPPAHARNLHHTAVAMYNAWAAYDPTAVGYLYNEKVSPLPGDIEAARAEAVSYAAYRVLRSRFASGAGASTSLASFDSQLTTLYGGSAPATGQAAITNGTTPAEVGKRIGQMILNYGAVDGFSNTSYPQAYNSTVNPNLSLPMPVLGTNLSFEANMPLGYGVPTGTDPNLWQPLDLATGVTQNGIPIPGGAQSFIGVQSLATIPFSLTRDDPTKPWIDIGPPSRLSRPGQPSTTDAQYKSTFMDVVRKTAHLNDTDIVDISPGAIGNNPLGTDNGTGFPLNPVTNTPYAPNNVVRGDFARVLAEFWADGPNSETPPGHWHVLANQVADNPLTVKKIKGVGPVVNNLEWDVKTYLSLSGAVHNAACAAWSLKRYYSGARPITAIRYMCSKGQSSNPAGPSYDPEGIPLEPDITEVITTASVGTALSPGKHYQIWDVSTNASVSGSLHIGKIAIRGWPGEHSSNLPAPSIATHQSMVKWMLGKDWLPFQRKTFNTPAFPGYISGHSTFSRSAAEVLTLITGSPYFPGGLGHHTVAANSMQIDLGPSAPVDLQWATYYDAADQAGQSRRWGGIHPDEDDYPARTVGSQAGISAFNKAEKFWNGSIQNESIQPIVTMQANGDALVTWPTVSGRFYKVIESTNMRTWSDASAILLASGTTGSFTDTLPGVGTTYQIVELSIARAWNEQLLAAIRRNVPNPPGHARNLHHTAVAMYDAWTAYDTTAIGFIHHERATAGDIAAARREAISYAAYRVLRSRFASGAGSATSLASFDSLLTQLGYSTTFGQAAVTAGTTPAEVGRRIGQAILTWGASDGFSNTAYPQAYDSTVNPNLSFPLSVLGTNANFVANMPLGYGIPAGTNPNFWQPLDLSTGVTQNGIPIPGGAQTFVGVQSLATIPFSLKRTDPLKPWLDPGPPSRLSTTGNPSTSDAEYKNNAMDVLRKSSLLNDPTVINISPGAIGNNPLGTDNGTGNPTNPATGQAYAANTVKRSDYVRVLAEYWADGPNSETPPGHWHVMANEVADNPLTVKKIRGTGPVVDNLEWDIKTYFALSGAVHDAACAAWALKRYYSGARPITMIRYMCNKGQSSNPFGPAYHPEGIPLETDVTEVITATTAAPGGKHAQIWDVSTGMSLPGNSVDGFGNPLFIGKIAVKSWPGEDPTNLPAPSIATHQSTVKWMLGKDWLPFQRKTFNTPAFPGYVSGHSTFSRSSAEVLTLITGSANFPGGFHNHTIAANSMQIDLGPSTAVDLQWRTYYDAADQAGQSRRWGGIHPYEDDFPARAIGSEAGISAFALAEKYWSGTVLDDTVVPTQQFLPGGGVTITCPARRGLYYRLEVSNDLINWTALTPDTQCPDTTISFTDPTISTGARFYRIVYDAKSS